MVAREEEGRVVEATEGAVMAAARVAEAREVVGEVPCRVDREVVMVVERVGGLGRWQRRRRRWRRPRRRAGWRRRWRRRWR